MGTAGDAVLHLGLDVDEQFERFRLGYGETLCSYGLAFSRLLAEPLVLRYADNYRRVLRHNVF